MTYGGDEEDCTKCSVEVKQVPIEENRQGGCARCVSASIKMDQFPCSQCIEEETKETKFPRFKRSKMWLPPR